MDEKLKAIETEYNGYIFRSRIEARWAVFFDSMDIDYHYEQEGFELKGRRYLPDFWIPSWNSFVEIKGAEPTEKEIETCLKLRDASGKKKVILLFGGIDPHKGIFFMGKYRADYSRDYGDRVTSEKHRKESCQCPENFFEFRQCGDCGMIWGENELGRFTITNGGKPSQEERCGSDCFQGGGSIPTQLENALSKAKKERFEKRK
jgi:hypothetical protein